MRIDLGWLSTVYTLSATFGIALIVEGTAKKARTCSLVHRPGDPNANACLRMALLRRVSLVLVGYCRLARCGDLCLTSSALSALRICACMGCAGIRHCQTVRLSDTLDTQAFLTVGPSLPVTRSCSTGASAYPIAAALRDAADSRQIEPCLVDVDRAHEPPWCHTSCEFDGGCRAWGEWGGCRLGGAADHRSGLGF